MIAELRGLSAPVWILFFGTLINRFGSFVVVFLVLYLTDRGYSPAQAGIAMGVYGVGALLASWAGGEIADRVGRVPAIAGSMFSAAAAMLVMSQLRGLGPIILFSGITGFTAELYRPASSALLADVTPADQHITVYALNRLAINLGFALGPAAGGFLAQHSFFLLFLGDAITCIAFGILSLILLPRWISPASGSDARGSEPRESVFRDRRFLLYLAASTAIAFVFFQFESTFPLHVIDSGYSATTYGLLLSINGGLIVLLELVLTLWTRRFPACWVIAAGYALLGLGFLVSGLAVGIPMIVLGVVIWTMGEITSTPVAAAFVAGMAPERMRGRYMGAWGVTWALGLILGPMIGTWIYGRAPLVLWVVCAAFGLLAALLVLVVGRENSFSQRSPANEAIPAGAGRELES